MELFIFRVAADLNHFHTVQKRPWNGLGGIGGGNEKHLGQIQRNLHIVVPEPYVLFSVKHFQKGGKGIPLVIIAYLVNFVKEHQRILHSRLL